MQIIGDTMQITGIEDIISQSSDQLEIPLTKLQEIQIDFRKHFQVAWMFLFDIPTFITV